MHWLLVISIYARSPVFEPPVMSHEWHLSEYACQMARAEVRVLARGWAICVPNPTTPRPPEAAGRLRAPLA